MKRLALLVGLVLVLASVFSACSIEQEGLMDTSDGGGGTGNAGGVAGGTCFPGSKVCPDKTTGELKCLDKNDPTTSCGETSCEACNVKNATAKCASEKCAIDQCNSGFQDCNNDPIDGCETNINSDGKNCGACGTVCGTNKLCDGAGKCIVNWCDPPTTADCNGDKVDCEVDLQTDAQNCGFCGNVCNLANAASTCSQGVCVVTTCKAGYANCDGNDANGCETNITNDTGNCGACGKVCSKTNGSAACSAGKCAIVCGAGYGNCDGNADTGCEIDLKFDPTHCGACPTACNPQNANAATCTNSACGYTSCKPGFGDCDGNVANGCEINLLQNKNHCGVCGKVCTAPSGGQVFCANGNCAQDCGSLLLCGSTCVNSQTDVNNCGSCGNVCPNGPANSTKNCVAGKCGWTCNTGFNACGSTTTCYNIGSDKDHCGSSCQQCTAPTGGTAFCTSGNCGFSCNGALTKCGGACVDTTTDVLNCGGCDKPCNTGGKQCVAGVCGCPAGQTDCSGVCTDTSNNNQKCGPTCVACTGGKQCTSGTCTCPSPQIDCSGTCTNTTGNNAACGPSCTACTGGKTCTGSGGTTCVCPSALPNECSGTCVNQDTDKNNCGACNNKCHSSAASCTGGSCVCATGHYCNNTLGCKECCGDPDCSGGQKCCGNVCQECCPGQATCSGGKVCCANGTCPTGSGTGSCPDAGAGG